MALTKRTLKGLIELSDARNYDGIYGEDDVIGVSTAKTVIPTKANLDGVNLKNYKLFPPKYFAFVADTSRRGDKIALAYNDSERTYIVSTWYLVFRISDLGEKTLLPEYLFLFFNRTEFDRYARANSWGSAREYFWFEDMEAIEITLPSVEIQQKFVDVYKAMLANQKCYESGLSDLKLTCDAYIEDLRRKMPCEKIGPYIQEFDERNSDLAIKLAQGVTNNKEFATPKQVSDNAKAAKIVRTGQFAYNRATTRNGEKISIAYRTGPDCVVSSAYGVFEITDKNKLNPEYLQMWFNRSEFDRYARYMSKGSAHEFFEFSDMKDVSIPIPDIHVQNCIVDIYHCFIKRKEINERLKAQIKDLCPILIRGSLQEGGKTP